MFSFTRSRQLRFSLGRFASKQISHLVTFVAESRGSTVKVTVEGEDEEGAEKEEEEEEEDVEEEGVIAIVVKSSSSSYIVVVVVVVFFREHWE